MADYSIVVKKSVWKDFKKIPKRDTERILSAIRGLAQNQRPSQAKRLSGQERYRLRRGNYRILYEIEDEQLVICVVKVGHRREVYR